MMYISLKVCLFVLKFIYKKNKKLYIFMGMINFGLYCNSVQELSVKQCNRHATPTSTIVEPTENSLTAENYANYGL